MKFLSRLWSRLRGKRTAEPASGWKWEKQQPDAGVVWGDKHPKP